MAGGHGCTFVAASPRGQSRFSVTPHTHTNTPPFLRALFRPFATRLTTGDRRRYFRNGLLALLRHTAQPSSGTRLQLNALPTATAAALVAHLAQPLATMFSHLLAPFFHCCCCCCLDPAHGAKWLFFSSCFSCWPFFRTPFHNRNSGCRVLVFVQKGRRREKKPTFAFVKRE